MSVLHTKKPDEAQRRRLEAHLSRQQQKEAAGTVSSASDDNVITVSQPKYSTVSDKQKRTLLDLLGDKIVQALQDPYTQDVMLNDDGYLWQDRVGEDSKRIGTMGYNEAIGLVSYVAGCFNMVVNESNSILSCEIPLWNGPRFECQVPPTVVSPTFVIRKPAMRVYTLDDYIEQGVITRTQRDALHVAVRERKNILIVGGTKSGKTTFVNGVIHEISVVSPRHRQIIIEDTREVQSVCQNKVHFCTSFRVAMTDLVKTSLRMSPDRIIVGEVRGPEAHDLLQAWNTGHPGGTATIHANDCMSGLRRLSRLMSSHKYAVPDPQEDIADSVHVLVNIQKDPECPPSGRRVKNVMSVEGWSSSQGYILKEIF